MGSLEYQLKSNYPPCIIEGCEKDTYGGSRRMCMSHYAVKQSLVKKSITTWEELEKEGKARPKLSKEEYSKVRKGEDGLKRVWSTKREAFVFLKTK